MTAPEGSRARNDGIRPARHAATVIATVAVLAALYYGHDFLVPVCLALVLTALLAPLVAWLARHRVPVPVAAALTVLAFLALLVGAGAALEVPLRGMARDIPKSITAARKRLAALREPLARIGIRFESQRPQSAGSANPRPRPNTSRADSGRQDTVRADSVRTAVPNDSGSRASSGVSSSGALSAAGQTLGVTAELLSELVEVLLLAAFLLAGGAMWGAKLAQAIPNDQTRHTTLAAVVEMRAAVARYINVTALINIGQGTLIALAMWGLGIPSPLLWGVLTFLLEFVPYLGGLVIVVLLLIAGLASGGSLLHAMLAPLSYLLVTTLQNNLVSPAAYGRGLRLNPAAILLAVMFWYTMWGVAGAFLAVPILAALRILTTKIPVLAPVRPFLEE